MQSISVERALLKITLVGLCLGIIFSETLELGHHFALLIILISIASTMLFFVFRLERKARVVIILIWVCALSLVVGLFRSEGGAREFVLTGYADTDAVLYGRIDSEPEVRESYLLLTLHAFGVVTEDACLLLNERALVRADRFENASYGDAVEVSGVLSVPEPFETDTGRVFSYDEYLKKDDIGSILSFATIKSIDVGGGNVVTRLLFTAKETYLNSIARYIKDPESALVGGLTVGTKQSLGDELERDFRRVGLIHIVVLSGYNIVIVAEAIMRLLRFIPIRTRFFVSSLAIALFVILVGAGATVVRAGIMAIAALFVRVTGNESAGLSLLFFAGIVMLLFEPMLLLHDPSFQLSFVATLGLICFSEPLGQLFLWIRNKAMRDIVTATLATQIAVLPLLVYLMGDISLVALPVNLLVLPTVPLAMFFGFLTGVTGSLPLVSMFFGPLFGGLSFIILSLQLLIVDMFASLPLASIHVPPISLWVMFLMYALLILPALRVRPPKTNPIAE